MKNIKNNKKLDKEIEEAVRNFSEWKGTSDVDFKHKEMNSPDIPEDAFVCPGSCEQCQRCWKMKSGDAVVFHQH